MDLAVNRAKVGHEMSTENRGKILGGSRGSLIGQDPGVDAPLGIDARNCSTHPDSYVYGVQGDTGILDYEEQ